MLSDKGLDRQFKVTMGVQNSQNYIHLRRIADDPTGEADNARIIFRNEPKRLAQRQHCLRTAAVTKCCCNGSAVYAMIEIDEHSKKRK